ncbi:hypothetical protein K443DRAFT_7552 [Laccaria amethystina LaAM-08-1]|uniref:Uncharacterized protein n=1 Tax=Laccaria amethystina LaAM-08-1 TaxID=1095629 RepID=A0A0C9XS85_9AGAR|nr:hypothetical protein K443DRAFT_7552 [Laccaria amethystina LaAM-08-1]
MPSLPGLAPELIQHISTGERPPYPPALLQAAKPHHRTPQVLRSLALYILRDHLDPGPSLLKTLSQSGGIHRATWGTSNLRIAACLTAAVVHHNIVGLRRGLDSLRNITKIVPFLTSLTLINIMVDTSRIPEDDPTKEESSTYNEICPRSTKLVSVNIVEMAFLQYISSYSGLKKIQLVPENFPHWRRRDSEFAARIFYEEFFLHPVEELDV